MEKILVATEKPFAKAAVESIKEVITKAGFEMVKLEKYTDKAELLKAVADVDSMIIRSDIIDRSVLEAAKNLKIVVRAGAGYDNIDLKAATEKGVVAMNTPGQNSNAVAELVFGLAIYMIRGGYDGSTGFELRGKTIGILAFGYIGKIVASIAKGFGMKVHAFDPFVDKSVMDKEGVICESSAESLFSKCQFISIHLPGNEKTKRIINYNLLKLMPENAILINTARKEVIDEESLLKIMEERKDFRYTSDIEADCKALLVQKYPGRFFFTAKKMGAQTHEANNNAGVAAANQVVNFFIKGDKTFQLNK